MNPDLILKTAPGVTPYKEIDLTELVAIKELSPEVNDIRESFWRGDEGLVKRSIKRRFLIKGLGITDAQALLLKRMIHDRMRVRINGNYNAGTVLSQTFRRADSRSQSPGVQIGPTPTFTRTMSNSAASATYLGEDGLIHLVSESVPRYELRNAVNGLNVQGMLIEGKKYNYFPKSHPQSGDLIWTLNDVSGHASWSWEGDDSSIVEGEGIGRFIGDSGDYLSYNITSTGSETNLSAFIYVQGVGKAEFVINSGATGAPLSTGQITLDPTVWTQLKIEDLTKTGTLVFRLYARETQSWMRVSAHQLNGGPLVSSYIHNLTATNQYRNRDNLEYDVQIPQMEGTLAIGFTVPPFGDEDQHLVSLYMAAGAQFELKYKGSTSKYYFQLKTTSYKVEWTPAVLTVGSSTVILIMWSRGVIVAYENGAYKGLTVVPASVVLTLNKKIYIGTNENTDAGFEGCIDFVRLDHGAIGGVTEVENHYKNYNPSADESYWMKLFEGRDFNIESPSYEVKGGEHIFQLTLKEAFSNETATTEEK